MEASRSSVKIAIVGAGLSGLACASALAEQGIEARLFEKSRGTGGRAGTHRSGDHAFDAGAQYFTARDPGFVRRLKAWSDAGVVQEWRGEIVKIRNATVEPAGSTTQRYVGTPGMSSLARHLAAGRNLARDFRIEQLSREPDGLMVLGADGRTERGFDAVLLAAPAAQVAALARPLAPSLAELADRVPFSACLALMLAFDSRLPLAFDGAFVEDSPLSWIARNSSKPGRPAAEAWVLHGAPAWSDAHFLADQEAITRALTSAFAESTGLELPASTYSHLHRWRFALPTEPLSDHCLFDPTAGIGACGDWCAGPRVEGAITSGAALALRVLAWASTSRSHAGGA